MDPTYLNLSRKVLQKENDEEEEEEVGRFIDKR